MGIAFKLTLTKRIFSIQSRPSSTSQEKTWTQSDGFSNMVMLSVDLTAKTYGLGALLTRLTIYPSNVDNEQRNTPSFPYNQITSVDGKKT